MEGEKESSLQDRLLNFVRANLLILALFSVGVILLGIGLIQLFGSRQTQIKFEEAGLVEGVKNEAIKIDVGGAVLKPGVYELPADARIQDVLVAAGGLSPDADRQYIEKAVNLAQKVTDGAKIYIPSKGESLGGSGGSVFSGTNTTTSATGLISINNASSAELDKLPGIGPVTAGKIIGGRPYGSVQELLDKGAVGKAAFEKIKDLITL